MGVPVNYLGVILAAVVSMVVGFIYYSPFVLGKSWMKLMGISDMKPKGPEMAKIYGTSFVAVVITAYVLFHISFLSMNFFHYSAVMTGITTAFWVWLGFIASVQLTDVLFGKKNWKLFGINTGYQLV